MSLADAAKQGQVLGFEMMFQKPEQPPCDNNIDKPTEIEMAEGLFFESVDNDLMNESVAKSAMVNFRAKSMAATFTLYEEAMNTSEEIDALAVGMADINEDGEVTGEEEEDYLDALNGIAEALEYVGVKPDVIEKALKGDDDEAEKAIQHVSDFLDDIEDEGKYIAGYSVRESLMMEAAKKVIRNGKVKWIKKPLRKRRMSSAQKAALKKARRKSNTGAAKRARRKSMKQRKSRGM